MNEAAALPLTGGYVVRPARPVLRPPPTPSRHPIHFPAQLETLQLGYVLGIGCNRRVTVRGATGGCRLRVDQVAAGLDEHCWTRYSAGAGAKGPRFYDWAFVACTPTTDPDTAGY